MFNVLDQPALAAQLCLVLLSEDQEHRRRMKDVPLAEEKAKATAQRTKKSRMRFFPFKRASRATA